MNQDLAALVGGALLAVAAMAYVLHPLFFPERISGNVARSTAEGNDIEERVRAVRDRNLRCRTCGIRPEADAIYCSSCGQPLGAESNAR